MLGISAGVLFEIRARLALEIRMSLVLGLRMSLGIRVFVCYVRELASIFIFCFHPRQVQGKSKQGRRWPTGEKMTITRKMTASEGDANSKRQRQ